MRFGFGHLSGNHHGAKGSVVRGPSARYVRIAMGADRSVGHRIWFYAPSGACWHIDLTLERTKEGGRS